MKFLLVTASLVLAIASIGSPHARLGAAALRRTDPVLVKAVIDGDTIDVAAIGRVRLLGIDAPEIGRGFDTAAPFARAARDRLADLVLHRWVRLETENDQLDAYKRHLAYVLREDGVCANTVLVREGLARVTARTPLARLGELKRAEAEAARSVGFAGKSCVHPSQVPIANRVFFPTEAEIETARRIVAQAD